MRYKLVVGTRPEAIKMAPVAHAMQAKGMDYCIVLTGQHPKEPLRALIDDIAGEVNVSDSDDGDYGAVVVVGDTRSAFEGAVKGYESGIPVIHVEAGLRTRDITDPWPEEGYRCMIDQIALVRFCPTQDNFEEMGRDYYEDQWEDHIVGQTGIDAIRLIGVNQMPIFDSPLSRTVFITLHRRETYTDAERMKKVVSTIRGLVDAHPDLQFEWIRSLNPAVEAAIEAAGGYPCEAIDPLPYCRMSRACQQVYLIISDSGGLVEERSYFEMPIISVREVTERSEAELQGCLFMASPDKPTRLLSAFEEVSENYKANGGKFVPVPHEAYEEDGCPFGDGFAAERIATHLLRIYG